MQIISSNEIKPNIKAIHLTCTKKAFNVSSKQVKPFVEKHFLKLAPIVLVGCIGLFINTMQKNDSDRKRMINYIQGENTGVSAKSEWPTNIRVLASTGQNTLGASDTSQSYTRFLFNLMKQKDITAIEQANDTLIKTGYKVNFDNVIKKNLSFWAKGLSEEASNKIKYPLATPTKELGSFNKNDTTKERFLLNLVDTTENRFIVESEKTVRTLKEIYGKTLKSENVFKFYGNNNDSKYTNTFNLKLELNRILERMNKLKNKNNIEFMIIYNGHGISAPFKKGAGKLEGANEGWISNFKETAIKELFKEKLEGIKTLFIVDSCYSGAWIAENNSSKNWTKEMARKAVNHIV